VSDITTKRLEYFSQLLTALFDAGNQIRTFNFSSSFFFLLVREEVWTMRRGKKLSYLKVADRSTCEIGTDKVQECMV